MDLRVEELLMQLGKLLPPGDSQPSLNAWSHQFRQKQAAIEGEARAVLRGNSTARLEVMVRESQCWPAMAATCEIGLQIIEWARIKETTNNKAAHEGRP